MFINMLLVANIIIIIIIIMLLLMIMAIQGGIHLVPGGRTSHIRGTPRDASPAGVIGGGC